MSKKKNALGTIVATTAAIAAIGGVCYMYRDKIKESKAYKDLGVDDKINKVKQFLDERRAAKEEDIYDDEDFDFPEDADRNYVSVSIDSEDADDTAAIDDLADETDEIVVLDEVEEDTSDLMVEDGVAEEAEAAEEDEDADIPVINEEA